MIYILIIIGTLGIFINAIVSTYILIDMSQDKDYKDDLFLFTLVLLDTCVSWIGTILIIKELIS